MAANKQQKPLPFNRKNSDYNLIDVLNMLREDIMVSMNCHAIATVKSFNSANQTITATINYQKAFQKLDQTTGKYNQELMAYPILLDIPVIVLGGLELKISAGMGCLILFNDRDIDNWFKGATTGPVASNRTHSFSDGIALVGLSSPSKPISDYDNTRNTLRMGSTKVAVSSSKVQIKNSSRNLNQLLQDLVTAIKQLTVTCAGPGSPSSPPVNVAAFTQIATQIGELLE